ncbi:protein hupE [Rhizobium sp. Root149]|jgi:urease accessory protein|uniref:Urease accessory protein n=1 Tax=Rhizobium rhizoryzae TaxID=451876 RepID=A0A7W6LC17_9HYPH|nr:MULTISPECIES: HupE/UreJ family protein [Rhizobium]KQZ54514.1 protein hupE [Rhizobium sp. Root149]MBB4141619.1 urease accessory protein [Rhizobium rhizoryzae]
MFKRLSLAVAMSTVAAVPAFAHLDPLEHGSIAAGLSHPLFGADHVLAMVAVGLWAAQIATDPNRRQALWLVPAAFVAMMVLGFGLAVAGAPLPFVEPAILASVMGLGLLVALAVRVPVAASAAVVGIFALFHGYAHGGELGSAAALQFGLGFAVATAFLHLIGVGLGMRTARLAPAIGRFAGAATALAGLSLAFGG